LTDETIEYIQNRQGKPFYAWVHYNDLHAKGEWHYIKRSERGFGDRPVDIYDSNAAYVDEHLGRLFSYLESTGLLESTIVAISADHGEEFLDHGQLYHSGRPYPPQTRVPLILRHPGVKPLRVKEPVSLIDLAPTFLRGVGLFPPREYKGVGLRLTAAGLAAGRKVFIETPRNVPQGNSFAWAVVEGDWLFIYDLFGNTFELYDKATDPTCRTNLIDTEPARAEAMMSALGGWLDGQSQRKDYRRWERF
jgi:arylsulfatase A-like enzyme